MASFTIDGRDIDVFPSSGPDAPIIYLNTFGHEGAKVYKALQKMNPPDLTLAAISNLDWDDDMTPWYCPPTAPGDTPCRGEADKFLKLLTEKIVPQTEENISGKPKWRGIAGYSLAGLFAVYSIYQCDLFSRVASMSGSLWYPDFKEYIFSHEMKGNIDHIYFSLGDKECRTKNTYLKTVQDNTDAIEKFYADKGIDTVFVLNPGNHYMDADKRSALGLDWILRR